MSITWSEILDRGRRHLASGCRATALGALLVLVPAVALAAPDDEPEPTGTTQGPDFRFSAPRNTLGIRVGYAFNRAQGEIFDFLTDELTLEPSDFKGGIVALDFGFRISDRVDLVAGLEYSRTSKVSEYRDFVDQDDIPIVQETELTQLPLTLSLKWYLGSRGQRVGQYAWVPRPVVPYIGAGGGFTWYELKQAGEFVDFRDFAIFQDTFTSDGFTAAAHVFAGLDIKLTPSIGLIIDARYHWANADLKDSFVGFAPIDLNGLHATAGVAFKF